jgi:ABC-type Mn2+/Zn2+ transport system ATPase subunit
VTLPVLEIEDARVIRQGSEALAGVSLRVHAGESVVLLGPNGAGKTTLLTAINGFTPLSSGSIRVLGLPLERRHLLAIRQRVGYVAQLPEIDRHVPITLYESVLTGLYGRLGWRRRVTASMHSAVHTILERLSIQSLAKRPLGQLSGGELRRATIARALVQEPEILLLDEPTASLDDNARREICAFLDELNQQQGMTLMWVTHDMDALPDSCTRVVRMKVGHIVADESGNPDKEHVQ